MCRGELALLLARDYCYTMFSAGNRFANDRSFIRRYSSMIAEHFVYTCPEAGIYSWPLLVSGWLTVCPYGHVINLICLGVVLVVVIGRVFWELFNTIYWLLVLVDVLASEWRCLSSPARISWWPVR